MIDLGNGMRCAAIKNYAVGPSPLRIPLHTGDTGRATEVRTYAQAKRDAPAQTSRPPDERLDACVVAYAAEHRLGYEAAYRVVMADPDLAAPRRAYARS